MKITMETPDKVSALLTVVVEEEDYKTKVEQKLKDYRRKANVPGFRRGQVPMGIIKRQFGDAIQRDEIGTLVNESVGKYLQDNNVGVLGTILPSETHKPDASSTDKSYTFYFDIALAPEINVNLSKDDHITYYDIDVDDEIIDQQVSMIASQHGQYEDVEQFDESKADRLVGDLRQLDEEGSTLEGGITVAEVSLMPQYIKVEEQKALFANAKLGDIIPFNPKKAYPDNDAEVAAMLKMKKEEVADITSDFSFQVTRITRYVPAKVDQQLFDKVFQPGTVNSEEEFRQEIAKGIKPQLVSEADYRFFADVKKYAEEMAGEINLAEDILKRVMRFRLKEENKSDASVDEAFDSSISALKWQLIKEKLVRNAGVQVGDDDIKLTAKAMARAQFAQYGMNDIPDDYLENYADKLLQDEKSRDGIIDRTVDNVLVHALKNTVTLDVKKVSLDEFRQIK